MGLGKLGLPVALAIESKGHEVIGYDINPNVATYLKDRKIPFVEKGIKPLLKATQLRLVDLPELVRDSDILFCAVQTPHEKKYEGDDRIPITTSDFDYSYLKAAVKEVAELSRIQKKKTTLVVISTCLPGTFNREIEPLLNKWVNYVYNPFFIAMGTVVHDFLNPEFVLIGVRKSAKELELFYNTIHNRPSVKTDITTAEAIKVSYNTFITMKTVLANTWGEIAYKIGANVDDIYKAWSMATDRLISPKYLKSGVGDGGGCHPRDNIALSHMARQLGLSSDIFEDLMIARENHMNWLGTEAVSKSLDKNLPIVVLGKSFKPETNIETGSPSVLMVNLMKEMGAKPLHVEDMDDLQVAVYVIGTQHSRYTKYSFPKGSVVIDPFRYIPDIEGVEVIRIGG